MERHGFDILDDALRLTESGSRELCCRRLANDVSAFYADIISSGCTHVFMVAMETKHNPEEIRDRLDAIKELYSEDCPGVRLRCCAEQCVPVSRKIRSSNLNMFGVWEASTANLHISKHRSFLFIIPFKAASSASLYKRMKTMIDFLTISAGAYMHISPKFTRLLMYKTPFECSDAMTVDCGVLLNRIRTRFKYSHLHDEVDIFQIVNSLLKTDFCVGNDDIEEVTQCVVEWFNKHSEIKVRTPLTYDNLQTIYNNYSTNFFNQM